MEKKRNWEKEFMRMTENNTWRINLNKYSWKGFRTSLNDDQEF